MRARWSRSTSPSCADAERPESIGAITWRPPFGVAAFPWPREEHLPVVVYTILAMVLQVAVIGLVVVLLGIVVLGFALFSGCSR